MSVVNSAILNNERILVVIGLVGAGFLLSLALPDRLSRLGTTERDAIKFSAGGTSIVTESSSLSGGPAARVRLRFKGLETEVVGIAWFLTILLVAWSAIRDPNTIDRFRAYLFSLSIVGMGAVFWIAWDGGPGRAVRLPVQYSAAAGCVAAVFLISTRFKIARLREVSAGFRRDLALFIRRPSTWIAAATVLSLAAIPPRAAQRPSAATMAAAFTEWFAAQPRLVLPDALSGAPVSLVAFIDYQCAACRSAAQYYAPLLSELTVKYPGAIQVTTLDFPLDAECNEFISIPTHTGACEAAAAARLFRGTPGTQQQMERWLWDNQRTLSRKTVFDAFQELARTAQLELSYGSLLQEIRRDIALGNALGVRGTPTYFLNGVKLSFVPAVNLRAAIEHELRVDGQLPSSR